MILNLNSRLPNRSSAYLFFLFVMLKCMFGFVNPFSDSRTLLPSTLFTYSAKLCTKRSRFILLNYLLLPCNPWSILYIVFCILIFCLTALQWQTFTQPSEPPVEQQLQHQVEETSAYEVDPSLFQSTEMFLDKWDSKEQCHL